MTTKVTASRIKPGESVVTSTGVRKVVSVDRFSGNTVLWVADPASPTGRTPLRYSSQQTVERFGLTTATSIRKAALKDAEVFASEFPGERIGNSDWDSEAWACFSAANADVVREYEETHGDGVKASAFAVYRETLRSAVESAARKHNERS